ncbi:L-threonylcarbamoyladenylate synthase [Fodinibius sediminis]|uniref:Threonylcarbamoyl-AMP synthase n=1 Tax=Fodinibius sediminis TaxID=1214077 RepID=A0A521B5X3_9BACT|nr:L-threonylcarbamoyladenylate synthase [Fodinibius sediminis]SMO42507.1 L-threonylcarbamoyladenylate synthase [Fodinibius sediminis]
MLDRFIRLLNDGEIVAFPTETVYGLGADAWNPSAIKKVFARKGRPSDNPLIVHVASIQSVDPFALDISDDARKLMHHFWPGPLTLIFKKKPAVLDLVTAGLDTVAIRWPSHPLSQELIARTGPLVAPSANSSGKPSPTKPEHVREDFGDDFPVIDAGETAIGLESTVLDVSQEPYRIYRPGAITAREIEDVIHKNILTVSSDNQEAAAKSPGTKYTHYAPDAAVRWLGADELPHDPDTLYLLHSRLPEQQGDNVISYAGDFRKLGHELYDRFRQADHQGYRTVAIEVFTADQHDSLVPALVNRIQKAAGSKQ